MTEFTSDPDNISEAFKKIKVGSSQNHLNDAAMQGANMLNKRDKTRRRVLLLIGETRDGGSAARVRDVLTEAEFRDIAVYAVEVSHFLTSLNYHPDPPQPSPIPPEARHLPAGVIAADNGRAGGGVCPASMKWPRSSTNLHCRQGDLHLESAEVWLPVHGRHGILRRPKGLKAITNIGEDSGQYLLTYYR
jgi:hypothetical protein